MIDSNSCNKYIIESIISKKLINNVPHYLVKWENWDNKYNTWESKKILMEDAPLAVENYEKMIRNNNNNKNFNNKYNKTTKNDNTMHDINSDSICNSASSGQTELINDKFVNDDKNSKKTLNLIHISFENDKIDLKRKRKEFEIENNDFDN